MPDAGETIMFGCVEDAVQLEPGPPANVTVTDCGGADPMPLTMNVRELGNTDRVPETTVPDCNIDTAWSAICKDPVLLSEEALAVTDQLTLVPETDTVAQATFELAVTEQLG